MGKDPYLNCNNLELPTIRKYKDKEFSITFKSWGN
jgi:hypothetical protein